MTSSINSNIASLKNNRQINSNQAKLTQSFEKLSTGKRINRASDDAAGLAVALNIQASLSTVSQATRNGSDAISASNIADGALQGISDEVGRLGELATAAANPLLNQQQRDSLNQEYQARVQEIDRVAQTTQFNGQNLLSGQSTSYQVGTDGSAQSQISTGGTSISAAGLGLPASISDVASARTAIDASKNAVASVSSSRSEIGAGVSRIETALSNLSTRQVGESEALSRIQDLDVAEESAKLTSAKILLSASAAIGAQANQEPRSALKLIG